MVREEKRGEKRKCNGERHGDGETDRDNKGDILGERERERGGSGKGIERVSRSG